MTNLIVKALSDERTQLLYYWPDCIYLHFVHDNVLPYVLHANSVDDPVNLVGSS